MNAICKFSKDYMINGEDQSHVIYVFDKDGNACDLNDNQFEQDVKAFCKQHNYKLIWFVRTIEDVMWKKLINSKDKTNKARDFIRNYQVESINISRLMALENVNARHRSNILTILDHFLKPMNRQ